MSVLKEVVLKNVEEGVLSRFKALRPKIGTKIPRCDAFQGTFVIWNLSQRN